VEDDAGRNGQDAGPDDAGPARGIVLAAVVGGLIWIVLIVVVVMLL
jgi:hypothetical protein